MKITRARILSLAVTTGVLVSAFVMGGVFGSAASQTLPPDQLTGSDLAKSMGLELVPGKPVPECASSGTYVEVTDLPGDNDIPQGYCLTQTGPEAEVLAARLQGRIPSADEVKIIELGDQINQLVNSGVDPKSAQVMDLAQQQSALQAALEQDKASPSPEAEASPSSEAVPAG